MIEVHWLEAVLLVLLGMNAGAAIVAWSLGRRRRRINERIANRHLARARDIHLAERRRQAEGRDER